MILHFLRRDFRDFLFWWVLLTIFPGVVAILPLAFPVIPPFSWLLAAYALFAVTPSAQIMGSVWRTQHGWSRQYLLSLPLSHKRLFLIQQLRMLVFFVPLLLLISAAPARAGHRFGDLSAGYWAFYYFAALTSVALILQQTIWMNLEGERISGYVPKGQRLWHWVKMFVVGYGLLAVLGMGWFDLLVFQTVEAKYFSEIGLFRLVRFSHAIGLFRLIFPLGFIVGLFWIRRNARRWCVTL